MKQFKNKVRKKPKWKKIKPIKAMPLFDFPGDKPSGEATYSDIPFEENPKLEAVRAVGNPSEASALAEPRGARDAEHGEHCAEGWPRSNTHPSMSSFKLLGSRIDSLYLSQTGHLNPSVMETFTHAREEARNASKGLSQTVLNDLIFGVHKTGLNGYPFGFSNADYHISLRNGAGKKPMAYTRVSSAMLMFHSAESVVEQHQKIIETVSDFCEPAIISRVDLCIDFTADIELDDLHSTNFVSSARGREKYNKEVCTGFMLGKGGDIVFRLYDKTEEIKKSGKYYMRELWQAAGWVADERVYRAEFQLNRKVLKQFGIYDIASLKANQAALWVYLTEKCVRVVVNEGHNRKDRRPIQLFWEGVQMGFEAIGVAPLLRAKPEVHLPDTKRLCIMAVSYIYSYMALNNIEDLKQGLDHFHTELRNILYKRDIKLEEHTQQRLNERRTAFRMKTVDYEALKNSGDSHYSEMTDDSEYAELVKQFAEAEE